MDDSILYRYFEYIPSYRQQLIKLLASIVDIHYVHFQKTEIYPKISNQIRTFNYTEQDILEKEIFYHFADFIRNLLAHCPVITKKEIIVSCLSLRFPTKIIAGCLGYSSTCAVRKHKSRIKHKLTVESENSFLFDFIFKVEEQMYP